MIIVVMGYRATTLWKILSWMRHKNIKAHPSHVVAIIQPPPRECGYYDSDGIVVGTTRRCEGLCWYLVDRPSV